MNFRKELEDLINRASRENDSDTPDWILAQYLDNCLNAFTIAVRDRDRWWAPKNPHKESIPEPEEVKKPDPAPWPSTLPPMFPIKTEGILSQCPTCGLKLDQGPMGYCCPHPGCPTGLGGTWC